MSPSPSKGNPTAADDAGLITRSAAPLNQEMPFSSLREFLTPNEQFYVRGHFPIPEVDARNWRLKVEGAVASPFELTYDELRQLPATTITATMECAGNGRAFLEPKVKGVAWDLGAVGNATWTGVLLSDLLARAQVRSGAREVILEGGDKGAIAEPPRPAGEIHYARSLPMARATADVLLAFAMNGEPLPPAHGFPLRAIVPGWFGMASVKWLQRIIVSETAFQGYFQSIDYTYWERREGLPTLVPLAEMALKAQIARPAMGEILPAGVPYRVHGAAWAGTDEVAQVELSTDDGATWQTAALLGESVQNAWRFWEWSWTTPAAPRQYSIIARARDSAGRCQPAKRNADYGSYLIHHWLPISVEVR
ncbi:MAG: sulfite oxidase [Verrucomicrobiota bacterium]|nr:sulfite oxidase [Verrucomicrobiota bacterium]